MSRRIGRLTGVVGGMVLVWAVLPVRGQATQPMAGEFRPGGYLENYKQTFYPGTELRALPGARAQAVVAAAEFRRAQTTLDSSIATIRRGFMRSPELAAALAEEKAAFDQLNAARDRALVELKQDSTYQAALDLKTRLAEQIEESKHREGVTPQERMAMASLKLTYATSVSAMESAAIAAEPSVAEAKNRLVVAGRRIAQLYQEFDEAVRTSPNVLEARRMVEDTRIAAVGSDALYVEALKVATVAMDYAYHMYDHPQPYIYNSPIYGGYGFGGYGAPAVQVGYPIGYPLNYPHVWGGRAGLRR